MCIMALARLSGSFYAFISPRNSYMHRKREVPGRNSGFTAPGTARNKFWAVKDSIYCPEFQMFISMLMFDQFS